MSGSRAGVTRDNGSPMAKVTLQSIADRVGVSRMTVSNAFSRPDQLSSELREKILAAADQLGYVGPDPAARALARGRTGSIGLLLTDELSEAFQDAVATEFLSAVATALTQEGMALTLLTSGDAVGAPSGHVPSRDVAMDGAIVYICDPASPDIAWLERRGVPVVSVDRDPSPNAPSVNVDDRGGARAAAQHVVDLGHTRVGILTLRQDLRGRRRPEGQHAGPRPDARVERRARGGRDRGRGAISALPVVALGRRGRARAAGPSRPAHRHPLLLGPDRGPDDPGGRVARPPGAPRTCPSSASTTPAGRPSPAPS